MIIKDLLKDTTAMVCGRIDSKENNVEKMLNMMEYNKPVLEACHSVILVLNRGSDVSEKEITEIKDGYKQTFKNVYLLQPHPVGMGHQVGHVTLDKTGYLFAKNNLGTKYTMKMCNDILVSDRFLDIEIQEADVYYLPAMPVHEIFEKYHQAKAQLLKSEDYDDAPLTYQTWFFIASNKTDFLYEPDEEIERVFRTWDINYDVNQNNILCAEHSLIKWSIQNKLKRYCFYTPKNFANHCRLMLKNRVSDGSLKNIFLEPVGIAHLHFAGRPVLQFNL